MYSKWVWIVIWTVYALGFLAGSTLWYVYFSDILLDPMLTTALEIMCGIACILGMGVWSATGDESAP